MTRALDWKPAALRDLKRLPDATRRRIVEGIERFASSGQGDVRRLTDVAPPEIRLRIGDWRIRLADSGARRIGHHGFFRSEHRDTLWPAAAEWLDRGQTLRV